MGRAPTPLQAANLSLSKIRSALKAAGRQRNLDTRAQEIQTALRTEQLTAPAAVTAAFAATTRAAVGIIAELNRQIDDLEAELATHFETHPDADIYRSLPGLGVILGARVLGEFGDDPNRYTTAKCRKDYAGTSPLTVASGKKRAVLARHVRNRRLYDAIDQWGLLRPQRQPGRPRLLRRAPHCRRPTPSSTTSPRQPPRRHPPRLPTPPNPVRRTQGLGTPSNRLRPKGRLTTYEPGMSSSHPIESSSIPSDYVCRWAQSLRCGQILRPAARRSRAGSSTGARPRWPR